MAYVAYIVCSIKQATPISLWLSWLVKGHDHEKYDGHGTCEFCTQNEWLINVAKFAYSLQYIQIYISHFQRDVPREKVVEEIISARTKWSFLGIIILGQVEYYNYSIIQRNDSYIQDEMSPTLHKTSQWQLW